jgi:uncharacterized paraquat-inducible protein A
MTSGTISCSKCATVLPTDYLGREDTAHCPQCGAEVQVWAFPSLVNPPSEGRSGEFVTTESEAGCFFHPQKKAVVPCSSCGRFLCALCDVEIGGQHLCPVCVETGKKHRKMKNLETHRTLYDNIALSVAILPVLVWFFTIVTAPISVYISIRHWKSPTSILPRTKIRFIIAIVLGLLQVGGWTLLIANWLV